MFNESFGSMVFNETVMKEYLCENTYKKLMQIRKEGAAMDADIAEEVADAMMKWAVKNGATHYTHWFQPMTGITAEKHDSFLDKDKDGMPILKFSAKSLIKGESDASSFPSGGMRATFEARGYTVWDPTSDVFIKENTLCIPTAFCSYTGGVLDKKTPLLRSMEALNKQALRVLRLFGDSAKCVFPEVGFEQEYFLINKEDYRRRQDLVLTGRTLFGAVTPKGQMLEDHYSGTIRPRVKAYMEDLDRELWKLGIFSKTEHNETAPCQHECAAIYCRANVAADENQLVMEVMKKVADRHDFVCLLHEKPFAGINGSGKHNNWSLSTDTGENLMNPGKEPEKNVKFLLFLTAVIRAVDNYQDLLRISVSTAGNDHRLGGNEAPPAIISMYLGTKLMSIVDAITSGKDIRNDSLSEIETNVSALPELRKDDTDRNRTSPFAYTGNKFEFRMPGSSVNISCANYILNTATAESLCIYADRLENTDKKNLEASMMELIKEELIAHKRIIFDGNGYGDDWPKEAERRGLLNLGSTPESYKYYDSEKNVELFKKHSILTSEEISARKTIGLIEYEKMIVIEARTLMLMADKEIIPACAMFGNELAAGIERKKNLGIIPSLEIKLLGRVNDDINSFGDVEDKLNEALSNIPSDIYEAGVYARNTIIPLAEEARKYIDDLESTVDKTYWPYPDYTDMLFYV